MKKYRVYQVDAFTKERFTGNPAGVVTNAEGLTEQQMLQIARELHNSETAFIFPGGKDEEGNPYDVRLRFFTVTGEVPLCGHATVSAHYVRAYEQANKSSLQLQQKVNVGILPVEVLYEQGDYHIVMTQGDISYREIADQALQEQLYAALGLTAADVREDCPLSFVSTGFGKVMLGIKSLEKLHSLKPDMAALTELSSKVGSNGYYVFVLMPETESILVHGRMFAPATGCPEDPVTGNANGPLGAYLVHYGLVKPQGKVFSFVAAQGEAMGRAGQIEVKVTLEDGEPQKVQIGGQAVIAFKTEIEL